MNEQLAEVEYTENMLDIIVKNEVNYAASILVSLGLSRLGATSCTALSSTL